MKGINLQIDLLLEDRVKVNAICNSQIQLAKEAQKDVPFIDTYTYISFFYNVTVN